MRRILAAAALAVAGVLTAASPAGADTGEATNSAAGPCGSSYAHVGGYRMDSGLGTLNVYWSSSAERNCLVVNRQGDAYGTSGFTMAMIKSSSDDSWPACPSTGCDSGDFSYYAGPVYTPYGEDLSGQCIDLYGYVKAGDRWDDSMILGVHCG